VFTTLQREKERVKKHPETKQQPSKAVTSFQSYVQSDVPNIL
jgi:hypothetical protein